MRLVVTLQDFLRKKKHRGNFAKCTGKFTFYLQNNQIIIDDTYNYENE